MPGLLSRCSIFYTTTWILYSYLGRVVLVLVARWWERMRSDCYCVVYNAFYLYYIVRMSHKLYSVTDGGLRPTHHLHQTHRPPLIELVIRLIGSLVSVIRIAARYKR